ESQSNEPIHQLFWHRVAGERFRQFYIGKELPLHANGEMRLISFERLLQVRWVINGIEQHLTLGTLIEHAKATLDPPRRTTTIIGHGDAHFGNVFLEDTGQDRRYLYFDPAFAGRHSPLLDIVKPLFHNVFATWMYFPREVAQHLHISVKIRGTEIDVEHDYTLTPIRQAVLTTKMEALLQPLKEMVSG